jgi:general secretion pathway protein J
MRNEAGRERGGQAGFSLLELLISATLLALLSVMMMGSVHFGTRIWERTRGHAAKGEEIQSARHFLQNILAQINPKPVRPLGRDWHIDFTGTLKQIEFVAPTPAASGEFGMATWQLRIRDAKGSELLELDWHSLSSGTRLGAPTRIIDSAREIKFEYYGWSQDSKSLIWQSDWQGRRELPDLIRIAFQSEEGVNQIQMVVAPRVEVSADCRYDPLTRDCRSR